MPRRPRLHVPGGFYHVTLRGNHRNDIFFRPANRRQLDGIMVDALERTKARLHAYCWMSNHIHLLVQVADQPLAALMQRVATRFARLMQKSVPTTGHFFENRYHALLVDADSYFLELLRYIHLNPVRAKIVSSPEAYRWSSHRVYLGRTVQAWVTTDFGLNLFHTNIAIARQRYQQFVLERIGAASDPTLYAGHPEEPRILGDDQFLARLNLQVRKTSSRVTLEQIAAAVCAELNITFNQLCSASQARPLAKARGLIACRALDEQIASLSEIARFLNRSAAAISRAAHRHQK